MIKQGEKKRSQRLVVVGLFVLLAALAVFPQGVRRYRIGERLSYNLSFGKFKDGGYAEMYVASGGKLGGKDAVEIRTKIKTIGLVSASFVMLDESRTVFVAPDPTMPLFIRRTVLDGPIPEETTFNFLENPSSNFDLVSLIYQLRQSGGTGSFTFFEGDQVYTAIFVPGKAEHVRTDAGEFDTTIINVQSEFLTTHGIRDMRINLTNDDTRLPVMARFKTQKGEFRATLAAVHIILPTAMPLPGPDAVPSPTPLVAQTPRPLPSPTPYVDNVPLSSELGFSLGEKLNYRISSAGQPLATVVLEASERKEFRGADSVLLSATVTAVDRPNQIFRPSDTFKTQVDPDTLVPLWVEGHLGPSLSELNQTATFDAKSGRIAIGDQKVDAPVGTHTLLSLMYAIRSFNLQMSKNTSNPVNDTRVAVFWNAKPAIFTLRPSAPADLMMNGVAVSAQLITITTGDPQLDALGLKVWLSASGRLPLRYSLGQFQADLIQDL